VAERLRVTRNGCNVTFEAASLAIKKSIEESFSLKRAIFLFLFWIINVRPVLWVLLAARQTRGRIKKAVAP